MIDNHPSWSHVANLNIWLVYSFLLIFPSPSLSWLARTSWCLAIGHRLLFGSCFIKFGIPQFPNCQEIFSRNGHSHLYSLHQKAVAWLRMLNRDQRYQSSPHSHQWWFVMLLIIEPPQGRGTRRCWRPRGCFEPPQTWDKISRTI